jgi:acyl-CoA reductase-like NAD-dependent aldehyde dehydrogenase
METDLKKIKLAVQAVLQNYNLAALFPDTPPHAPQTASAAPVQAAPAASRISYGDRPGIFKDLDAAVSAASAAQKSLIALPLGARRRIVEAIKKTVLDNNESLSLDAVQETGLGNVRDKITKNVLAALKTPGPEDVESAVWTDENGLTLMERAPYGVLGAITPCTNPIATVTSNALGMISAGNTVVFNVHPAAKAVSCRLTSLMNEAIMRDGGPANLLVALEEPTIETANALMRHQGIALLVITGGPAVVKAAMNSGKKAICAGPGNPPCVVDETADIGKAGAHIVNGAGFDNNIVCICEKEILAVQSIADRLKEEMKRNGAFELSAEQTRALTSLVIAEAGGPGKDGAANKAFVGKSPQHLGKAIGLDVPANVKILLCEVDKDHPLVWTEQLMPFIPLVRMRNADEAIDYSLHVEHGYRHTAMIHSHDIERLSRMAKLMNCSLFVKNGPCYAGLGQGGAGYTSFTIASPTGEGVTRARTFTRERRCTLVDSFRII